MDRLIAANSVPSPGDIAPTSGTAQFATDTAPGTVWPAYQYNTIQEELIAVLTLAGITPDRTNTGQVAAAIAKLVSAAQPTGSVIMMAGNAAPSGFYACDGSSKNTTTDAALFAVIGYAYGGSGTSFNLPDARGVFPRGWGGSFGYDPGRTFGSIQLDDFKAHTHNLTYATNNSGSSLPGHGDTNNGSVATASTGGTETRPVNIAWLFCIKR